MRQVHQDIDEAQLLANLSTLKVLEQPLAPRSCTRIVVHLLDSTMTCICQR